MKYTDLCARLEAPAVLDSFIDPKSARAAMLEAAAAIRELEAGVDEWERQAVWHNREHGKRVVELRAAEARVAELTRERDAERERCAMIAASWVRRAMHLSPAGYEIERTHGVMAEEAAAAVRKGATP